MPKPAGRHTVIPPSVDFDGGDENHLTTVITQKSVDVVFVAVSFFIICVFDIHFHLAGI